MDQIGAQLSAQFRTPSQSNPFLYHNAVKATEPAPENNIKRHDCCPSPLTDGQSPNYRLEPSFLAHVFERDGLCN